MVFYKTEEEIDLIKKSSLLVAETLGVVARHIKPGITTLFLDKIAEEYIRDNHALPAFKGYNGFPNTLCISPNAEVVHGIPTDQPLEEGDIIAVDCGVKLNGYYGDSAYTFPVGEINDETKFLLRITMECLQLGVEQAVEGRRLGDISWVIQQHAEKNGFSVVRELVGHGIGKQLHEKPEVPNYGKKGSGMLLKEGLVIAIEPMINAGKRNIVQLKDGWTIKTADNKNSAHYEHTVAVRKSKPEILTTFEYIEKEVITG